MNLSHLLRLQRASLDTSLRHKELQHKEPDALLLVLVYSGCNSDNEVDIRLVPDVSPCVAAERVDNLAGGVIRETHSAGKGAMSSAGRPFLMPSGFRPPLA
mmetsp:Transcript_28774/g.53951  ORF Transcript_28774/g.53951 Transcript_28774/m.53951 type:complete len:101 (-) Transcript_28774:3915-4217(-)